MDRLVCGVYITLLNYTNPKVLNNLALFVHVIKFLKPRDRLINQID